MDDDITDLQKLDEVLLFEKSNDVNILEQLNLCISDDEDDYNFQKPSTSHKLNDKYAFNLDLFNNDNIDVDVIKPFLSHEEFQIISQCQDDKLRKIMVLNRYKVMHLKNLEVLVNNIYSECLSKNIYPMKAIIYGDKVTKLGYPYFKTLNNYTCPPNEDVKKKKANGEVWIDYMPKPTTWTENDIVDLKMGISVNYYKHQIQELQSKLSSLQTQLRSCATDKEKLCFVKEISRVKNVMKEKESSKIASYPKLNSNFDIDWLYISAENLKGRHSPRTCEALWNLFLHPSLNKSTWTEAETFKLREIANKYSCENWDAIASELGSNRSSFVVCTHYYENMKLVSNANYFSQEEDKKLLTLIDKHKIGNYIPWNIVQGYFNNRTKAQLYSRYNASLVFENKINKGNFSRLEDVILYCVCKKYGENFKLCKRMLNTRSEIQLRTRYRNYINCTSEVQSGYWTLEEDKIILDHIQNKETINTQQLSKLLNRRQTSVRHRSYCIFDWLRKNKNKSLEEMPRKTGCPVNQTDKNYLEEVRELGDKILCQGVELTTAEVEKFLHKNVKRRRGKPSEATRNAVYGIKNDQGLIDYFKRYLTTKDYKKKSLDSQKIQVYVDLIQIYLGIFNAKLKIPFTAVLEREIFDLDEIDLLLLKDLRDKPQPIECKHKLIPPTLNSVVSLRYLLLKFMKYKLEYSNGQRSKIIASIIKHHSLLSDDETASHIKFCTDTFVNRLNCIYTWPSLMSITERDYKGPDVNEIELVIVNPKPKCVGRPKKDLTKIQKMRQARDEARKRREEAKKEPHSIISNFTSITNNFQTKPTFTYSNKKRKREIQDISHTNQTTDSLHNTVDESSSITKLDSNIVSLVNTDNESDVHINKPIDKISEITALPDVKKQKKVNCQEQESSTSSLLIDIKSELDDIELLDSALKEEIVN